VHYSRNNNYIALIPAAEFKDARSREMWLKFRTLCIVVGFVTVYSYLTLFLIHYGSCPCKKCTELMTL